MAGHSPSTLCCVIILLQMPCGLMQATPGMSGAGGCEPASKPRTPLGALVPVHSGRAYLGTHLLAVQSNGVSHNPQPVLPPAHTGPTAAGTAWSVSVPQVLRKFSGTETESVRLRFDSTALQGDSLHDAGVVLFH